MNVKQAYDVLNSITKQMVGLSEVTVTDTTGLVDLGKTITGDEILKEQFFKTLWDRIGKTIITQRVYNPKGRELVLNAFEYGAMLQKLYVSPMTASENPSWEDLPDGEYNMVYLKKAEVSQDIFENRSTWEIDTAIPDIQIKSAFLNESAMAAFIDGIMLQLENSMKLNIEALSSAAYSTAITQRLTEANNTSMVIDLWKMYEATMPGNIDTNNISGFYRFCAMMIKKVSDHMESMSTLYNTKGRYRHTPKEYQRLVLLSDFATDIDVYLQSDVWHNELTKLTNYTTVNYWQGSGIGGVDFFKGSESPYSFSTPRGKISVTNNQITGSTENVRVMGLIGDIQSIGLMFDNMRVKSIYDPRHEFTAIYSKGDKGYYIDPSENLVVFISSFPQEFE